MGDTITLNLAFKFERKHKIKYPDMLQRLGNLERLQHIPGKASFCICMVTAKPIC